MDIISAAKAAFPEIKFRDGEDYYRNVIGMCRDVYGGDPPWGYARKSGLYGRGYRKLAQLGCAKVLCDNMAALTFSNQADIYCGDGECQKYVEEVLRRNGFWENMPGFFSRAYALGGGALKVYLADGEVRLDYTDAENFLPLGYGYGGINDGVFGSGFCRGGVYYTLLERQRFTGTVSVERALFASGNGSLGERVPIEEIFPGLEEKREYGELREPCFAYFRPAAANNLAEGQLFGLSCFANCMDTLKALDIAFDSFSREFVLGRKRIIVPSSCIRTVVDPDTGNVSRYFDADDEVYQALKCDEERDLKITDNTAELRVTEHVEGINALLNILCFQTGLSAGTLSFSDAAGVRTAAEIKSMETRTDTTMQLNRSMAAEVIEKAVRAIIACGIMNGDLGERDIGVRVTFSDRQTADRSEVIDRNIKLVNAGLKSRLSAVMEVLECSEEEARTELERIKLSEIGKAAS
ncbi:MAG: phage portal protein [Ruminococcus sp.]|nr:phage portal protein [Ruminococcus sp.]